MWPKRNKSCTSLTNSERMSEWGSVGHSSLSLFSFFTLIFHVSSKGCAVEKSPCSYQLSVKWISDLLSSTPLGLFLVCYTFLLLLPSLLKIEYLINYWPLTHTLISKNPVFLSLLLIYWISQHHWMLLTSSHFLKYSSSLPFTSPLLSSCLFGSSICFSCWLLFL